MCTVNPQLGAWYRPSACDTILWGLTVLTSVLSCSIVSLCILLPSSLVDLLIALDFQQSFFNAKAVKPPVELALAAINSTFVIQAGHMAVLNSYRCYRC